MVEWDKTLFLWLNGLNSPTLDVVMWHVSGKFLWLPLYLFLLYCLVAKYKWHCVPFLLAIILTIVFTDQISVGIKNYFQRLRPSHNPEFEGMVHLVNNYRGGLYGFVSSHAANSFGLAAIISLIFRKKRWVITMFVWATVVSYSRIYLGVHYPADIAGGAVVGIITGVTMFLVVQRITAAWTKYKFKNSDK